MIPRWCPRTMTMPGRRPLSTVADRHVGDSGPSHEDRIGIRQWSKVDSPVRKTNGG
jgi:hypothetical protein